MANYTYTIDQRAAYTVTVEAIDRDHADTFMREHVVQRMDNEVRGTVRRMQVELPQTVTFEPLYCTTHATPDGLAKATKKLVDKYEMGLINATELENGLKNLVR